MIFFKEIGKFSFVPVHNNIGICSIMGSKNIQWIIENKNHFDKKDVFIFDKSHLLIDEYRSFKEAFIGDDFEYFFSVNSRKYSTIVINGYTQLNIKERGVVLSFLKTKAISVYLVIQSYRDLEGLGYSIHVSGQKQGYFSSPKISSISIERKATVS